MGAEFDEEFGNEDEYFTDQTKTQENGLPFEWAEAGNLGDGKVWVAFLVERIVFYVIAVGVYYLHIKVPSSVNEEGLVQSKIVGISNNQLSYFYLAAFVFVHIKVIMGYKTVKYRQDC